MASLDGSGRHRDALPSINNFDFEKYRINKVDHARHNTLSGSTLSHVPVTSPSTTYSGPPPPYSSSNSIANSMSGYISPPESNSRRSTRDDKESPKGMTFLPSISEALKNADVSAPAQSHNAPSAPGSATASCFADAAPRGPGNPFSQPPLPASAFRSSLSSQASIPDSSLSKPIPPPPAPPDSMQPPLVNPLSSPRANPPSDRLSGVSSSSIAPLESTFRSPYTAEPVRPGYPFSDHHAIHTPTTTLPSTAFTFEHHGKREEMRNPFTKPESVPYGETIKRHLDVFDAGLALKEISEASTHTLDFSKIWSQRHHQSNHTNYFEDNLPALEDIDEVMRLTHHMMANLAKLREVTVMQQTALNEERARAARGQHAEDDLRRMSEDFKSGAFANGDAKKRRGKAAPPGRCHSCNRAETPEWRRGPDGARTLCNACGLHYAKLSRKVGANKAAVFAGSNLRPKG